MRSSIAFAALILAGCAMTPEQVREQGAQHDYPLAGKIDEATRCIIRNAEERNASMLARARDTGSGEREIIVRQMGEVPEAMAVVMLRNEGAGSLASMKVNPSLLFTSTQEYGRRLVVGC